MVAETWIGDRPVLDPNRARVDGGSAQPAGHARNGLPPLAQNRYRPIDPSGAKSSLRGPRWPLVVGPVRRWPAARGPLSRTADTDVAPCLEVVTPGVHSRRRTAPSPKRAETRSGRTRLQHPNTFDLRLCALPRPGPASVGGPGAMPGRACLEPPPNDGLIHHRPAAPR